MRIWKDTWILLLSQTNKTQAPTFCTFIMNKRMLGVVHESISMDIPVCW